MNNEDFAAENQAEIAGEVAGTEADTQPETQEADTQPETQTEETTSVTAEDTAEQVAGESADAEQIEPGGNVGFEGLSLPDEVLAAVKKVGFEQPSQIQEQTIPLLMEGRDVVGLAQTGTGKTAAFALPILARIDRSARHPQALILAPTRELALQVSDSFQSFADHLGGISVLPIYGGQAYGIQLLSLIHI